MSARSRVAGLAQHDHYLFDDLARGQNTEVAMAIAPHHTDFPTDIVRWHRVGHHLETLRHGVDRSIVDDIASTHLNTTIVDT